MRTCHGCGGCNYFKKLFVCKGCYGVLYCDRKCQKSHWHKHKTSCIFSMMKKFRFYSMSFEVKLPSKILKCHRMRERKKYNKHGGYYSVSKDTCLEELRDMIQTSKCYRHMFRMLVEQSQAVPMYSALHIQTTCFGWDVSVCYICLNKTSTVHAFFLSTDYRVKRDELDWFTCKADNVVFGDKNHFSSGKLMYICIGSDVQFLKF